MRGCWSFRRSERIPPHGARRGERAAWQFIHPSAREARHLPRRSPYWCVAGFCLVNGAGGALGRCPRQSPNKSPPNFFNAPSDK
jgi:hypothetical protein